MAVRSFNGTSDTILFGGSLGNMGKGGNGQTLLLVVKPQWTSGTGTYISIGGTANATSASIYQDATTELVDGADNPPVDIQSLITGFTMNQWAIIAMTKPSGTNAPTMHWKPLGSGSWVHATGNSSAADTTIATLNLVKFSSFTSSAAFVPMRLAAAALYQRALTNAELSTIESAHSTVALDSAGPLEILEFNQATVTAPVGLKGVLTQSSIAGTSVVTGDDPTWSYGLSVPSTAAGQYGWGNYGDGDYGPNFGGDLATPISGSESFTMTEQASVVQVSFSRTDAWALSEGTSSVAADLQRVDSFTFAELVSLAATLATSDALTHSESPSSVSVQQLLAASDAWALTDLSSLQTQTDMAANDSATQSESPSSVAADLQRADSWSLTDTSAVSAAVAASDSGGLSDTSALQQTNALNANETHTQGEASAVDATLSRSDSGGFTDLSSVAADLQRTDSWAFTDSPAAIQSVTLMQASDSWTVAEAVASLTSTDLKSASDSSSVTDTVAGLAANVLAADLIGLLESSAINATLLTGDAWSLSDLASVQSVQLVSASDSAALSEQSGGGAVALSTEIATDSPYAYYKLADLTDSSGNGRDLSYDTPTHTTNAAAIVPSESDGAQHGIGFAGLARTESTWTPTTMTMEAWVSFDSIYSCGVVSKGRHKLFLRNTGELVAQFDLDTTGSAWWVDSTQHAATGTLYHLAATYDGSYVRLFINGQLEAQSSLHSGIVAADTGLLRVFNDDNSNFPTGTIDEAVFYDHALSPARIAAHYAAGMGANAGGGLTAAVATADSGTLSESSLVAGTVFQSANDAATESGQSAIAADLSRSDSSAFNDASSLATILGVSASDLASQTEGVSALSATLGASDGSSITDLVLDLSQTLQKAANDSFGLNESSTLAQIVAITRTDAFTLSAEVAGIVELITAPYIHHKVPLDGLVSELPVGGTVLAMVADGVVIAAVTAGTARDNATLGTPPAYGGSGTVLDATDAGTAPTYTADATVD